MNDTLTLPVLTPPERKCRLDDVFDANFIELLTLVPANPYVRALILKFTGQMPPTDCELFEPLKDWVEFNCVKRIRKAGSARSSEESGIAISVGFTEMESGRANYSVERFGTGTFEIAGQELFEMVQDAIAEGGAIRAVVDAVARRIDDDAWSECDPNWNDYGDYEYNDHDSTDSENGLLKYSREDIRVAVLQFVRERQPELEAEL